MSEQGILGGNRGRRSASDALVNNDDPSIRSSSALSDWNFNQHAPKVPQSQKTFDLPTPRVPSAEKTPLGTYKFPTVTAPARPAGPGTRGTPEVQPAEKQVSENPEILDIPPIDALNGDTLHKYVQSNFALLDRNGDGRIALDEIPEKGLDPQGRDKHATDFLSQNYYALRDLHSDEQSKELGISLNDLRALTTPSNDSNYYDTLSSLGDMVYDRKSILITGALLSAGVLLLTRSPRASMATLGIAAGQVGVRSSVDYMVQSNRLNQLNFNGLIPYQKPNM